MKPSIELAKRITDELVRVKYLDTHQAQFVFDYLTEGLNMALNADVDNLLMELDNTPRMYSDLSRFTQLKVIAKFMDEDVSGRTPNEIHDLLLYSDQLFNREGYEVDEDEQHKLDYP